MDTVLNVKYCQDTAITKITIWNVSDNDNVRIVTSGQHFHSPQLGDHSANSRDNGATVKTDTSWRGRVLSWSWYWWWWTAAACLWTFFGPGMRIDNTLVWQLDTPEHLHLTPARGNLASCMGWGLGIMKKCTALSLAVNYESNEYLYATFVSLHCTASLYLLSGNRSLLRSFKTVKPICFGDHVINYTNNEDMRPVVSPSPPHNTRRTYDAS